MPPFNIAAPALDTAIQRGSGFALSTAPQRLAIADLRRDGGTQPRAGLDADTITTYAALMDDGVVFAAVDAFYDGTTYWLVDGFHRTAAMERRGETHIATLITQGTLSDAIWHSYSVNKHGLQRSNADKRRAVARALKHPNAAGKSDRELARHVGVDHKTVGTIRAELATGGEIPHLTERQGGDGKIYQTSGISTANTARASERPNAPAGWVWRNDGVSLRRLADNKTTRGYGTNHALAVAEAEQLDQPADPPTLPAHLAAAGYQWLPTDGAQFIIAGPGGWAGSAPTVAGALQLAEDRYQALQLAEDRQAQQRATTAAPAPWGTDDLPVHLAAAGYTCYRTAKGVFAIAVTGAWAHRAATAAEAVQAAEDRYRSLRQPWPQAQPAATIPADIADAARALGLLIKHDGGDLWLYWPSEADSLAQDGDDGGGSLISPWLWPQQAEEVRAWLRDDAPGLAETRQARQEQTAPAPADWRHDPALVWAVARLNDAVRGNDRANVLRAVRAVVAAIEAMEED